MRATGIVRRIDDLGRIVIPKEIRRTMRIRCGDSLEIFTDGDGVIFKKYSPIGELTPFAAQYAEVLHKTLGIPVLISDRDRVIAACGNLRRECADRHISAEMEKLMENRRVVAAEGEGYAPCDGIDAKVSVAAPIISHGDISGCVMLFGNCKKPDEAEVKLATAAAAFLAKQLEE